MIGDDPTEVVGVDLAWGTRKPDGGCRIRYRAGRGRTDARATITDLGLTYGDDALLGLATELRCERSFWAVDAPLVCVNETGSRPVDKLTHQHFRQFHAGCHPANLRLCPRPPALLRRFRARGYRADWNLSASLRLVAEVYPHPAMVRWFGVPRVLKYKRPPKANRLAEFARYQRHVRDLLGREFPFLDASLATAVLTEPWTKDTEDQLDAVLCALIGLWHVHHRGQRTEVLGDRQTGFILLPKVD